MQFRIRGRWKEATAVLLLSIGSACSSSPPPSTGTATESELNLELHPGDAVNVQVWREDDLSGEFMVDDRGIVTLPLLGERAVAGLGSSKLRDELLADYRRYLNNPSIQVTILRRINILGAVTEPGLYPVDATISLSEALGLAGGILPTGDADEIRLVRGDEIIRRKLDRTTLVGAVDMRSGDHIVVGEKGWLERNPGALVGSLIAAAAGITIALIR